MNKERAKELLPIIQAYAEGEQIEYRNSQTRGWITVPDPSFFDSSEYRVKPKPLECWVNVCGSEIGVYCYGSRSEARKSMSIGQNRTVHMREVED